MSSLRTVTYTACCWARAFSADALDTLRASLRISKWVARIKSPLGAHKSMFQQSQTQDFLSQAYLPLDLWYQAQNHSGDWGRLGPDITLAFPLKSLVSMCWAGEKSKASGKRIQLLKNEIFSKCKPRQPCSPTQIERSCTTQRSKKCPSFHSSQHSARLG